MKQLLTSLLPVDINSLNKKSEEERTDETKKLWFSDPRAAIESVAPAIFGMKFAGEYLYELVRA